MPSHHGFDAAAIAVAAIAGLLGRLMAMADERRNPISVQLLWELPAAFGMGIAGAGIAQWCGVEGGLPLIGVAVLVSYVGPRYFVYTAKSWLTKRVQKE